MKPHEEWLFKAGQDIRSASILRIAQDPVLDIAIYHTQQCAEKALKAYLAFKNQEIDKTHNLDILNGRCIVLNKDFEGFRESALFLMPFSTVYRYPEGDLLPSTAKVDRAIDAATNLFKFVKATIGREEIAGP
jgi:HEPN domain-containing protein